MKKKRGNGEGSITKRKDGFMGQIMIGTDKDGKRIIKTVYGKSKREVNKKITDIKSQLYIGAYYEPSKMSLDQWLNKWLTTYKENTVRSQTKALYRILINSIISPNMGYMKINDIKPIHIQKLINYLIENQYAFSTIEKIKNILKPAFEVAVLNKLITETPFQGIQLPERTAKQIRALSREEQKKLEEAAIISHFYEFFILGLYTGARCGELLALTWDDIDLNKRLIKISKTLITDYADNGKVNLKIQSMPKTKSSNRSIPIPKKCLILLENLRKLRLKNDFEDNNIVFCSKVGTYAYPKNVRRSLHSVCKNANIDPIGIHVLRHSYATRLFEEKVDIKKVSELLGHAKIDLTYNQYIHVFTKDKLETAEILNNLNL